jgi:hypothetical protein
MKTITNFLNNYAVCVLNALQRFATLKWLEVRNQLSFQTQRNLMRNGNSLNSS